ncbi:LPXTG cell wall anchor domain-containing protein [Micromonospora sp. WMMA1363]|uniref:LPXTG cell wall anchor domain-containing protein n=1 Tax=Micromonospora sp. WMMA1363 TaxID=3053985 RepID=UPI00259D0883|nr:LPXTG cell wall anchor domain-containing protein [Micromonospora sp. WMMA1363]MDM4722935.1 LPXTG cell wall anchor domain-containing protein [Micromonospora sp. WMMA1363]
MKRLQPLFRRATAVAAGTLLGLSGVAILAAPASAHHSEIKVQAKCDTATGEWVVDWTINNYAPRKVKKYKFVEVSAKTFVGEKATDVTIPGIAVTADDSYPHATDQPLTATQRLDSKVTKASLAVRAAWDNGFEEEDLRTGVIELSGTCAKDEPPTPTTPKPTASVTADCEGTVAVKLENAEDATAPAEFLITGTDGFSETATVEPGKSTSVTVPAKNADSIKVVVDGIEEPLFDGEPALAENCVEPGEPAGAYQSTCDELIFEISNPEDGETVTVTFTPNKGETKTLTVKPGTSGTVSFPAEEGLTVTPSAEGLEDAEPIAWEQPADCAPGGGGGDEDEPTLPLTGAATGGIIAGAAVLLAAGAVLFVVTRRRKLRFTA